MHRVYCTTSGERKAGILTLRRVVSACGRCEDCPANVCGGVSAYCQIDINTSNMRPKFQARGCLDPDDDVHYIGRQGEQTL